MGLPAEVLTDAFDTRMALLPLALHGRRLPLRLPPPAQRVVATPVATAAAG